MQHAIKLRLIRKPNRLLTGGWLRYSRATRFEVLDKLRGKTVHCAGCYYLWQGECMACTDDAHKCAAVGGGK